MPIHTKCAIIINNSVETKFYKLSAFMITFRPCVLKRFKLSHYLVLLIIYNIKRNLFYIYVKVNKSLSHFAQTESGSGAIKARRSHFLSQSHFSSIYSFTESEIDIKSEIVSLLWPRSQDSDKSVPNMSMNSDSKDFLNDNLHTYFLCFGTFLDL